MTAEGGQVKKTSRPSRKYLLILIPILLYYNAIGLSSFIISEWIHDWVKMQAYPNETINSSSVCESVNRSDPDYIMYNDVSSKAAVWMLYNSLGGSIPAVISSLLLPSYSDSLGRRFLFVIGIAGYLVKCIFATVAIQFNFSPVYTIIGGIIEGMCGSYYLLQSALFSYIADCTTDGKQRTIVMAAMDGTEKLSMTVSGFAAGYFISAKGYRIPMYTTCAMTFVAFLFHIFIIPESHPKVLRSKTFSVFGNIRRTANFYTSDLFKDKRSAYLLLIVAYFLTELTSAHRTTMELIYQLGRPFCWSAKKIGYFSAARHATQGVVAIFLVKPLKKLFSEIHLALFSTVCKVGSYVLEGLARTDLELYMVPILATFSNLALSMIKSIMSLMTPPDKQGALFASIFAVYGMCGICAPFLMNGLYAGTVSLMSGLVFLVLAGIACVDVVIQLGLGYKLYQHYVRPLPRIYWATHKQANQLNAGSESLNR